MPTTVTSHRASTFTFLWFEIPIVEQVVTVDDVEQSATPVAAFATPERAAGYAQSIPSTTENT